MGCGGSKDTKNKTAAANEAHNEVASHHTEVNVQSADNRSAERRSVDVPAGRATNPNDANITNTDAASTAAPKSRKDHNDVDEFGNPVVLPKGDWTRTENTPYYYSALENLYYHPPSCQFYDPTNEMWYDPEKDEWYHDDEAEEGQVAAA